MSLPNIGGFLPFFLLSMVAQIMGRHSSGLPGREMPSYPGQHSLLPCAAHSQGSIMEHSTDSGDCKPEGKARARRTSRRGESAIAEAVAGAGRLIDAHPEVLDWIREDRLALGRLRKSRLARDARLRRSFYNILCLLLTSRGSRRRSAPGARPSRRRPCCLGAPRSWRT